MPDDNAVIVLLTTVQVGQMFQQYTLFWWLLTKTRDAKELNFTGLLF